MPFIALFRNFTISARFFLALLKRRYVVRVSRRASRFAPEPLKSDYPLATSRLQWPSDFYPAFVLGSSCGLKNSSMVLSTISCWFLLKLSYLLAIIAVFSLNLNAFSVYSPVTRYSTVVLRARAIFKALSAEGLDFHLIPLFITVALTPEISESNF